LINGNVLFAAVNILTIFFENASTSELSIIFANDLVNNVSLIQIDVNSP